MEIALTAAFAFLSGTLTAALAATWLTRHRHDDVRRELAAQRERVHTLECLLLYRGAPMSLPAPPPYR
ncbi:hypothetical protein [Amycolatopsis sp. cmx-4-68]|uniref:hypothetical protein n=1 Tax=Amycolatopsis sp. cmx-4-68 TaxID=2790938 RepID=UPI00397C2834